MLALNPNILYLLFSIGLAAVGSARSDHIPAQATATAALDANTDNAVAPITAVVDTAATRTVFWSTTQTSVSYPIWIGPTVVTMITTQTLETLIPDAPEPTGTPGTGDGSGEEIVETVIGRTTYEYQMWFSDGHSSTSWLSETHSYRKTATA
ncbi:hypothetical protein SCUCBS95973_009454 [Sporothrix curviconia]|uniref:Uncharacterized protein n=1 Tax=Sporothrix curviconia TaxID=1260050 RepID=A0ABP0CVP9_9PEZI